MHSDSSAITIPGRIQEQYVPFESGTVFTLDLSTISKLYVMLVARANKYLIAPYLPAIIMITRFLDQGSLLLKPRVRMSNTLYNNKTEMQDGNLMKSSHNVAFKAPH